MLVAVVAVAVVVAAVVAVVVVAYCSGSCSRSYSCSWSCCCCCCCCCRCCCCCSGSCGVNVRVFVGVAVSVTGYCSFRFRHLNVQKRSEPVRFQHLPLKICFAPQHRALFERLNFQERSMHEVSLNIFDILTSKCASRHNRTACTFSTSQRPKLLRT